MKINKKIAIFFGIFFVLFLMTVGNAAAVLEEGTEIQITTDTSSLKQPSNTVPYAYVTNYEEGTVSVIDTATNTVTATVPVGHYPEGVAVSPDGTKVYVTSRLFSYVPDGWGDNGIEIETLVETGTVSVIDTVTNNVTASVNVGVGPQGAAVSPDGTKVYVTNEGIDTGAISTVSVIDTATNTVTATVNVGIRPRGIAVTPDGTKIYVMNYGSNEISIIDTANDTVTATVNAENPWGIAISPDGTKVYVTNNGENVSVIDTATNTVTDTVPVGGLLDGVAVSPDGTKVYVTNGWYKGDDGPYYALDIGTVSVIDTATNAVTATVDVGNLPRGVVVSPDGTKVYVTNFGSGNVSVIDTATNTITASVNVGSMPIGVAVTPTLEPEINTTQITTDTSSQLNPDVYGDKIVWQDARNGGSGYYWDPTGNWDIYLYDVSTSTETRITTGESCQINPAIYGDKIVWQDDRDGKSDIYMYDLSTQQETQISTSGTAYYPAIYGDRIVWKDDRDGISDIYMYDLSTSQETQISTLGSAISGPDIYNDRIVWQESYESDETTHRIVMYDLSTQQETNIAEGYMTMPYSGFYGFAIHGDKIVYNYFTCDDCGFIDMYDLSTQQTTEGVVGNFIPASPAIYGDRIVWVETSWEGDYNGEHETYFNIYMHDLSTQQEIQISTSGTAHDPAIYGDRIVWQDERNGNLDIYMFTLASDEVPEPPVADFSANITSGYAPLSVQFTDLSKNAVSFKWDFGDGANSTEKNPIHTYSTAGIYTVNLTVSNEYGKDSELATINVSEKTVPDDNDTDEGVETQITTNNSSQRYPDIYGERIVWQDDRNGYYDPYVYDPNWDIYLYDLFSSTETQITTNESNQSDPAIYGDRIVWTDDRNGNYDIYMFNISTSTETQITTNESNQSGPAIYGDRIVWTDDRNGNYDIYMFNISTSTESQITTNESNQRDPDIYGDRIVWTDERNKDEDSSTLDIYMYDLSTSTETQIAGNGVFLEYGPAIYGDRVVYMSEGAGDFVWMYDLSTSEPTFIAFEAWSPDIYGDRIVWMFGMVFPDVYMYDLSSSREIQITSDETVHQMVPAIYGDRIVWEDDRNGNPDIYMFTLASDEVPSPDDNDTDEGNETDDDTEVPDNDSDDGDDTGADDDTGVPDNDSDDGDDTGVDDDAGDDCSSELTPLDSMQALKEYVECTYRCHEKTKTGLASLLEKSMCFYENGEDKKAISMLKSFIHLAEKMKVCKQISADEADYMVNEATKILNQMGEGDGTCKENEVPDTGSDNVEGCVTDEVCEETKPVCEETVPVCEPVCKEPTEVSEPVCEEPTEVSEPVCEETKSVCESVCEITKSICEVIKPVCEPVCEEPTEVSEPVCEEPKPVSEPACEEPKPVSEPACEESKPVSEPTREEPKQLSEPAGGDEKPACDEGQQDSEPAGGDEKPACNEGQQDSEPAGGDEKPACGEEKPDSEPAGGDEDQQDSEPTCEEPKQVSKPVCEEPKDTLETEKSCEADEAPAASSEDKESEENTDQTEAN